MVDGQRRGARAVAAKAASGTIVSLVVLTEAPVDALDLPLAAMALIAALRAELLLGALALALDALLAAVPAPALVLLAEVPLVVTVPLGACVVCVPLAAMPEVLT